MVAQSLLPLNNPTFWEGDVGTPGTYIPIRYGEIRKGMDSDQAAFEECLRLLYSDESTGTGTPRVLDGEGFVIHLDNEIDVADVTGVDDYANWHMITRCNLVMDSDQEAVVDVKTGTIAALSDQLVVASTASLSAGMEVTGTGLSRGTYIKSVDSLTTVTLNTLAWTVGTAQSYTFTKHQFMLNWRKFQDLARSYLWGNQLNCAGFCGGVQYALDGVSNWMVMNRFTQLKERGFVDYWRGSGGLNFAQNDLTFSAATQASAHGVVTTSNDFKFLGNRVTTCKHHQIHHGGGILINGNHWWGGDNAGLVMTGREYKSTVIGNYIDNNWIELSDEAANLAAGEKYIGLINITGNHFTSNNAPAASWRFIKVAPHIVDRQLAEIDFTGNTLKDFANGSIPFRIDGIDTTNGTIDHTVRKRVFFANNGFKGIGHITADPHTQIVVIEDGDDDDTFDADFDNMLPFEGRAQQCTAFVPHNTFSPSPTPAFPKWFVRAAPDLGVNFLIRAVLDIEVSGRFAVTASANTEF